MFFIISQGKFGKSGVFVWWFRVWIARGAWGRGVGREWRRGRGRPGARRARLRRAGAKLAAHAALRAPRHVQALRQAERAATEE